ncbi:MAG: hypothetical protein Q8Q31_03350 [Nanoarchaeota archaeon]|nr:hypothetical protein [Nanoarchaeota archaeon]
MAHNLRKVVIDGPDCAGKSTCVEHLKNTLRWDSRSLHHKEGDQFSRYLQEYASADDVVFDRSHISEQVYSALWRGGDPFDEKERDILNEVFQYNSIIIFACPSLEQMQERYSRRSFQQQIRYDELKDSRDLFVGKMEEIPHFLYTSSTYEELDKIILEVCKKLK